MAGDVKKSRKGGVRKWEQEEMNKRGRLEAKRRRRRKVGTHNSSRTGLVLESAAKNGKEGWPHTHTTIYLHIQS